MAWQDNRIESAINGTNPMVIKELAGSFVALGDTQFLPGYCVLLPKRAVGSLNDLTQVERQQFLLEMAFVGDAILHACQPVRINYDILGNTDQFLHAHIFPRYQWENQQQRSMPVWLYDRRHWTDPQFSYDPTKHAELRQRILQALNEKEFC